MGREVVSMVWPNSEGVTHARRSHSHAFREEEGEREYKLEHYH